MVTYKHITWLMENDHGFKFKSHYKPSVLDYLRHVMEPRIKELEAPAAEATEAQIKHKSFFEEIPEQEKTDN